MNDKWITIKGRKMLPISLFFELSIYQFSSDMYDKSIWFSNAYTSMTRIIKAFLVKYEKGETVIPDDWESYINMCGLSLPKERRLPEAIEEMFDEMEKKLFSDFSPVLDKAVKRSIEDFLNQNARHSE